MQAGMSQCLQAGIFLGFLLCLVAVHYFFFYYLYVVKGLLKNMSSILFIEADGQH